MSRAILTGDAVSEKRAPRDSEPAFLWTILWAGGMCLAVVGWTDVALLWYPLEFGNLEWEFGTVGAHVMGMPLGTLGILMVSIGAIGRGWQGLSRVAATACGMIALSLVGLAAIYALVVPMAWAGTAPEVRLVLVRALIKTIVYLAAYFALYTWLALYVWKASAPSNR
jgi:fumarate reductase subunit D